MLSRYLTCPRTQGSELPYYHPAWPQWQDFVTPPPQTSPVYPALTRERLERPQGSRGISVPQLPFTGVRPNQKGSFLLREVSQYLAFKHCTVCGV